MPRAKKYSLKPQATLAILIGISEYEDFQDVTSAPNNVHELAKVLQDESIVGIPPENIYTITEGSSAEIKEQLFDLTEGQREAGITTLILYFAGHGYRRPGKDYYLVAKDSKKRLLRLDGTTGIAYNSVKQIIGESGIPQSIILLDACYSGAITMGDRGSIEEMKLKGSYVISSSDGHEVSYFDPEQKHTLFTGELLAILKNGLPLKQEKITLEQLYAALSDAVRSRNAEMSPQHQVSKEITGTNYLFFRNRQYNAKAQRREEIEAFILKGDLFLEGKGFWDADYQYLKAKELSEEYELADEYGDVLDHKKEKLRIAEELARKWKQERKQLGKWKRSTIPAWLRSLDRQKVIGSVLILLVMAILGPMIYNAVGGNGEEGRQPDKPVAASNSTSTPFDNMGTTSSVSVAVRDTPLSAQTEGIASKETKNGESSAQNQDSKPNKEDPPTPVEIPKAEKDEPLTKSNKEDGIIAQMERNMVTVYGGQFTMGCTEEQGDDCFDSEKRLNPLHTNTFQINKYEVTQEEWRAVMGSDPKELSFSGCDKCPVERVSWNDVQEFIKKLNAKTGKHYRLPSEAEWEYAARGGQKSKDHKYAGSRDLGSVGWYSSNSGSKTHPVGTLGDNELGLHDMSGNVWEWCQDHWHSSYAGAPADGTAWEDADGVYRVLRGGSWNGRARLCRVAGRNLMRPINRHGNVGFRLAHSS
ncbi:MAG: SUMF1/EgtB/PvdO family nonheme iron enzyme [Bacteroidota bacterium]